MINSSQMYTHALLADAAYAKFDESGLDYEAQLKKRLTSGVLANNVARKVPIYGGRE